MRNHPRIIPGTPDGVGPVRAGDKIHAELRALKPSSKVYSSFDFDVVNKPAAKL